jgi:hypothetical protein
MFSDDFLWIELFFIEVFLMLFFDEYIVEAEFGHGYMSKFSELL